MGIENMKESNFPLRMSKKEKNLLKRVAKDNGVSMNDYVRYRVFINNQDISDEGIVYESPDRTKDNYLTARVLQDIYLILLNILAENKTEEEVLKIKKICREHAEQNIAKFGYLKIEHNPNQNNQSEF